MKTADLEKLIQSILVPICPESYQEIAKENAGFPHAVWTLTRVDLGDLHRDDYFLDIDVWDRSTKPHVIDTLTDQIEAAFSAKNLPQDTILPTFYRSSRTAVVDDDKRIKHRILTIEIQNYEV